MTVQELIEDLNYRMSSGEIYPSTPVVREWGEWNADGSSNYKEVMTAFMRRVGRTVTVIEAEPEGIDHPVYRWDAPGEPIRLVVLD